MDSLRVPDIPAATPIWIVELGVPWVSWRLTERKSKQISMYKGLIVQQVLVVVLLTQLALLQAILTAHLAQSKWQEMSKFRVSQLNF